MQVYEPLLWLLQAFGLFIAFTVQGAMWKGAEDHGALVDLSGPAGGQ